MNWRRTASLIAPLGALLAGCAVPQSDYDQVKAHYEQSQVANRQLQTENQALQAQLAQQAQQNTYTVATDMLFGPRGFEITAAGQAALNDIAGKLRALKSGKITVYGYTDNEPIGPPLKKQGIASNMDLSAKRAEAVAAYLRGHGVNPGLLSAQGRGDTRPLAANNTAAGRAQNRRVEIVVEGPGS